MRGNGRRAAEAAVVVLLLALFAFPIAAHAAEPAGPSPTRVTALAADECPAGEQAAYTDAAASSDTPAVSGAEAEAHAPQDGAGPDASTEPTEASAVAAPEATSPDELQDQSGTVATGSQVSSQANPDTRAAIEAVLKSRKRQFDTAAAALQRSIDQLAAIIRRLDAAGVNTSVARARLTEARAALTRARTAESTTVARYRAVLGAEDESGAYASARAAARVSSAQLERARVKVLTATKMLRAIVKNVTV